MRHISGTVRASILVESVVVSISDFKKYCLNVFYERWNDTFIVVVKTNAFEVNRAITGLMTRPLGGNDSIFDSVIFVHIESFEVDSSLQFLLKKLNSVFEKLHFSP